MKKNIYVLLVVTLIFGCSEDSESIKVEQEMEWAAVISYCPFIHSTKETQYCITEETYNRLKEVIETTPSYLRCDPVEFKTISGKTISGTLEKVKAGMGTCWLAEE